MIILIMTPSRRQQGLRDARPAVRRPCRRPPGRESLDAAVARCLSGSYRRGGPSLDARCHASRGAGRCPAFDGWRGGQAEGHRGQGPSGLSGLGALRCAADAAGELAHAPKGRGRYLTDCGRGKVSRAACRALARRVLQTDVTLSPVKRIPQGGSKVSFAAPLHVGPLTCAQQGQPQKRRSGNSQNAPGRLCSQ
jgi:hypothetical protein